MTGPGESSSAKSETLRLPLGVDAPAPPQSRLKLALLLVLVCAAAALLPIVLWQRLALATLAAAGLVRVALALRARRAPPPMGEVAVQNGRIERRSRRGTTELATFGQPFGLAVFADPRRTRAILAFTTPTSARYLNVRLGEPEQDDADRAITRRAAPVAESDAMGAQLDEATLSAADALTLVELVEQRAPEAAGRIFESGPSGEPVVLDRGTLCVGAKVFDLAAPLEWKAFEFTETVGAVTIFYHATWVRQDVSEVVLVSPMPPEVSSLFVQEPEELRAMLERSSEMQRVVAKDLRIMQPAADAPPPVETRIAVERMFMFPLRRALDTAPRARVSVPPFRTASQNERNLPR